MGIFGGEKYSKEGLERAKEQLKTDRSLLTPGEGLGFPLWIFKVLAAHVDESRGRVEKIYGKGQAEAIALNEEYNRLLARAQEAIKAVADFEREKLGMHKEGAEKVDAEK